uniref:Sodium channel protein 60E-like n=1 Tax=Diabrotica virgifera virgifera TaxID=50390 RepID=A0A6P7FZE3_DIAVI
MNWTQDPSNWLLRNSTGEPYLCGNVTGSRHCPPTHTCLCTGGNPNHGYTSFDNFLWSMLTTFQLITLDYWENVYNMVSGLKTIINALLHSFKQLAEVMTLTIFCLMVFALFALQVYKGELRNKCVLKMDDHNASYEVWFNWTQDPSNWLLRNSTGEPYLCGNVTGSRHCPPTHTCLCTGGNPNHGYTSFDNFLWSMLTTFQLITLDYWENVYNM